MERKTANISRIPSHQFLKRLSEECNGSKWEMVERLQKALPLETECLDGQQRGFVERLMREMAESEELVSFKEILSIAADIKELAVKNCLVCDNDDCTKRDSKTLTEEDLVY